MSNRNLPPPEDPKARESAGDGLETPWKAIPPAGERWDLELEVVADGDGPTRPPAVPPGRGG